MPLVWWVISCIKTRKNLPAPIYLRVWHQEEAAGSKKKKKEQKTITTPLGVGVVLGGAYYLYDRYQKKNMGQFRNASGLTMRKRNYASGNMMAKQSKFGFASAHLTPEASKFNFAAAHLMPTASKFN